MIPYVRNNYNAIEPQYEKEESDDFGQGQREYKQQFLEKKKVSVWEDHQNWGWVKTANFEANSSGFQARQKATSLLIHRKFQLSIFCILKEAKSVFSAGFPHSRAD